MKLNNIKELQDKKAQLKSEIAEMESVIKFENPRKSFGVISNGLTDQYLGKAMESNVGEKVLPLAGKILKSSLKVGGAKLFNDVVKKKMTKAVLKKGAMVVGGAVVATILAKKAKQKLDEYQREQTAKSLEKLI